MNGARPALVDRCPHCGKLVRQRRADQSGGFHAILHDIAEQRDWPRGSGNMLDIEAWKRLIVAAFEREKGRHAEFYPAVDGHGMDVVYRRTSRMSDIEMDELRHFARACAIELDVVLREPKGKAA